MSLRHDTPEVRGRAAREPFDVPIAVSRAIEAREQRAASPVGAPRNEVLRALKHARTVLGLRPATMNVIEQLCLKVPERDWLKGTPLVFATNLSLSYDCHCVPRTLIRHINCAERFGLLRRKSSSNGKRYQIRSDGDDPIDGRGLDLSPLLERLDELRELAALYAADCAQRTQEAQALMEQRRALRDLAVAFRQLPTPADDAADDVLDALDQLMPMGRRRKADLVSLSTNERCALADALAALDAVWTDRFEVMLVSMSAKTTPQDDETVTLYIRQQPEQIPSSLNGRAYARQPQNPLEKEVPVRPRIPLQVLVEAWPSFFEAVSAPISVDSLYRRAEVVRRDLRVGDVLWGETCATLQHDRRALVEIVAYVHERVHSADPTYRIAGLDNPGGYFRALVDRAKVGKLHLAVGAYARIGQARLQQPAEDEMEI